MKLSVRFAIIALFTLSLVLVGFFISNRQIRSRMSASSQQRQEVNERATQAALESITKQHRLFVRDYSYWDDMAEAVQKQDVEWIAQEFFGPLEIYHADAAWVLDAQGALLYESHASSKIPFPAPAREIATIANPHDLTSFYLYSDNELVSYVIGPILYHSNPSKNTQPYGYVIVAVKWGNEHLSELDALMQAHAHILPGTVAPSIPNDPQVLNHPFTDFHNNQVATLQLEFNDHSLALLSALFRQQALQTAVMGVLGIIGCSIFLHFMIIAPTKKLVTKLRTVTTTKSGRLRRKIASEIDTLSELIDDYMEQAERLREKNHQLKEATVEIESTMKQLSASDTRLRAQLQDSMKLSKAVESASDAIIITDSNARIEYVNPAWQALNGYSMDEARGQRPSMLKSNRTNSTVYKHLWEHLQKGLPYGSDDVINKRKDGSLYAAHISVFPVREGSKTVNFVGIVQDISVNKEREHLKSEFISLASHQLRTPLTSLRWLSELLRKNAQHLQEPKTKDIIKDIEVSAQRMIALVNRLLNLSRIETGRLSISPSKINVHTFIKSLRAEIDPFLKKKSQRLLVKIQEAALHINTDSDLLHEALTNLLSNAYKYTPDKGVIALKVEREHEYLRFTIIDSGIGVPESEQKHIFERFFRASNAQAVDAQGSGLGLYLVKLIVEVQGGEIEVSSSEGKGTQVSFTLPIKAAHQAGEVTLTPSSIA